MKGPTIWRLAEGRARRTCISPRSTARGIISISIASALMRSPGTGSGQGLQLIYRPPKTSTVQSKTDHRYGQALFPSGGQHASASAKGFSKSASSFFGEFTRVEIGHIAIGSEGKDRRRFSPSRSGASHRL